MEQLKEKEAEVKRLNECLEVQRKELQEELTEKIKQLELECELRKELESMFQQSLFDIDNIKSNSKLLRFYTGFPKYEVFGLARSFLGRHLCISSCLLAYLEALPCFAVPTRYESHVLSLGFVK